MNSTPHKNGTYHTNSTPHKSGTYHANSTTHKNGTVLLRCTFRRTVLLRCTFRDVPFLCGVIVRVIRTILVRYTVRVILATWTLKAIIQLYISLEPCIVHNDKTERITETIHTTQDAHKQHISHEQMLCHGRLPNNSPMRQQCLTNLLSSLIYNHLLETCIAPIN